MRHVWLVLASAALRGCDATGANSAYREQVAQSFGRDCKQEPAPDAKLAKDLDQLCSCTVAEIRSGDIAMGDGRETVTAKIKDAMATCSDRVYGAEPPQTPERPESGGTGSDKAGVD
jgi:hypothetical protein